MIVRLMMHICLTKPQLVKLIIDAFPSFSYPESLKRHLLSAYNLDTVRSIAWGTNHDSMAIRHYKMAAGAKEEPTG